MFKLLLAFFLSQPHSSTFPKTIVEHVASENGVVECVVLKIGGTSAIEYHCRDLLDDPKLPGVVPHYNMKKFRGASLESFTTYKPSFERPALNNPVKF